MDERERAEAEGLVRRMLELVGEDPARPGLVDTPARVVRSWEEMFGGLREDPARHLARTFPTTSDQMVLVNGIGFHSTCEHHLLPFHGTCDVAYVPTGCVVGLSKFARLVHGLARRPQIQEQLTNQVADAIAGAVHTRGVAVRVRAQHLCMVARGARSGGATMTTAALRGSLLTDPVARSEWIAQLPP